MDPISVIQGAVGPFLNVAGELLHHGRTKLDQKKKLGLMVGDMRHVNALLDGWRCETYPIFRPDLVHCAVKLAYNSYHDLRDIKHRMKESNCLLWLLDSRSISGDLDKVAVNIRKLIETIERFEPITYRQYVAYMSTNKNLVCGGKGPSVYNGCRSKGWYDHGFLVHEIRENRNEIKRQGTQIGDKLSALRGQVSCVNMAVEEVGGAVGGVADQLHCHDQNIEDKVASLDGRVRENGALLEIMLEGCTGGGSCGNMSAKDLYCLGKKLYKDPCTYGKAFVYFKSAAYKCYVPAYAYLALCYHYGKGTPKSLKKAIHWYLKGAQADHVWCMVQVAKIYAKLGRDCEARPWFKRAAKKGNREAMQYLMAPPPPPPPVPYTPYGQL